MPERPEPDEARPPRPRRPLGALLKLAVLMVTRAEEKNPEEMEAEARPPPPPAGRRLKVRSWPHADLRPQPLDLASAALGRHSSCFGRGAPVLSQTPWALPGERGAGGTGGAQGAAEPWICSGDRRPCKATWQGRGTSKCHMSWITGGTGAGGFQPV